MKRILILLSYVYLVLTCPTKAPEYGRGCLYIFGRCVSRCPVGTHSYVSPCSTTIPTWSERTCKSPIPHDMGPICDLSRCDCDEPTVKDETTGKCVKIQYCPH